MTDTVNTTKSPTGDLGAIGDGSAHQKDLLLEILWAAEDLDDTPPPIEGDLTTVTAAVGSLVRRAAGRWRNAPDDRTDWPDDAAEILEQARESSNWRGWESDNRRRAVLQFTACDIASADTEAERLTLVDEWARYSPVNHVGLVMQGVHLLAWIVRQSEDPAALFDDMIREIGSRP